MARRQQGNRNFTALETLNGEALFQSGIVTKDALLYDSTHVRGQVGTLKDVGGLVDDDSEALH